MVLCYRFGVWEKDRFLKLRAAGQRNQQGMGKDGMAQYGSCVVERTIFVCTLKRSMHR